MKQAKILTRAEYKRVMAVLDAHRHAVRNRTMFALSFYAGLRACEIAGLKAGDIGLVAKDDYFRDNGRDTRQ